MRFILIFSIFLVSFNSHAIVKILSIGLDPYGVALKSSGYCGADLNSCMKNDSFFKSPLEWQEDSGKFAYGCNITLVSSVPASEYYINYKYLNCYYQITRVYFTAEVTTGCANSEECFYLASENCESQLKVVDTFSYFPPDDYLHSCKYVETPQQECENLVTQSCSANFGFGASTYTDNGDGTSSCSGNCADGTDIADIEDCSVFPHCDVSNEPSELDLSFGNTGSSVAPSNTTTVDSTSDIDYTPDGSDSDLDTSFNEIQGDSLINEIIKNRNANTENLTGISETSNAVIVEKADDIQQTISNSTNALIDAVNSATPFYDGNIVDSVNGLGETLEGLDIGSNYQFASSAVNLFAYDNFFTDSNKITFEQRRALFERDIKIENDDFYNTVKEKFTLNADSSGSYQTNMLDLGKWGSHDISIARFADFFGGVGNIVYFLAALSALFIVLGGVKL